MITWDYQGSIPVINKRKAYMYIYEYKVHNKNSMAYSKNVHWDLYETPCRMRFNNALNTIYHLGLMDILNVKLHVK